MIYKLVKRATHIAKHPRTVAWIAAIMMLVASVQPTVSAMTQADIDAIAGDYPHFDIGAASCGATNAGGASIAGSFLPTGPGSTLDGHTLPAMIGGSGNEERAVISNGTPVLAPDTNNPGDPLALKPQGASDIDAQYYINMRWNYAVWSWRGDSNAGREDKAWYESSVRKVLVTYPKVISDPNDDISVVTSVLDAGPAPWTGVQTESAITAPGYWPGFIEGTPAQYKGRVSGLAPAAFLALGETADMNAAKAKLQRQTNGAGPDLFYQWAPDQNVAAGTMYTGAVPGATAPVAAGASTQVDCPLVGSAGNFVYYSQYDNAWAQDCYGGGTRGNCTYSTIAAGGCGPSSLAMVVSTLNGTPVTPKEVADYSTQQGWYLPGTGSSWNLFNQGPQHWGLKSEFVDTDIDRAISAIQAGALVIASGRGATPYTDGGHIIVIRGVTPDGKLLLGDPNVNTPADKAPNNTKEWSQSEIVAGLRGLWIITK